MPREEIKKANPGGVRNRPAPQAGDVFSEDPDYPRPLRSIPSLKRARNLPALLGCFCGGFALLIAVGSLFAHRGGFSGLSWMRRLAPSFCIAGLFGVLACLLAVGALHWRLDEPTKGGVLLSLFGMVTGGLAILATMIALIAP